jgi:hypothetical protein
VDRRAEAAAVRAMASGSQQWTIKAMSHIARPRPFFIALPPWLSDDAPGGRGATVHHQSRRGYTDRQLPARPVQHIVAYVVARGPLVRNTFDKGPFSAPTNEAASLQKGEMLAGLIGGWVTMCAGLILALRHFCDLIRELAIVVATEDTATQPHACH